MLLKIRGVLPGSLKVRTGKYAIPKGKAYLPTIIFQGKLAVKLRLPCDLEASGAL